MVLLARFHERSMNKENRVLSANLSAAARMGDAEAIRFVDWVRGAAPYFHAFRGKTFVLAFGGEVAQGESLQDLCHDCNLLGALGVRLVLVHGARPQIEAELSRRGLDSKYHKGLRVTDEAALECVKAAVGVTRIEIEACLSQGAPNTPMAGGYMRVTGGNFVTARPIGVVDGIDFQYTGTVRRVIADEIKADLDQQNVVLISTLGVSPSGEIFNLVMEEVAEEVAAVLGAEKLIYLCDAPGLLDGRGAPDRGDHGGRGSAQVQRRRGADGRPAPVPAACHQCGEPWRIPCPLD